MIIFCLIIFELSRLGQKKEENPKEKKFYSLHRLEKREQRTQRKIQIFEMYSEDWVASYGVMYF